VKKRGIVLTTLSSVLSTSLSCKHISLSQNMRLDLLHQHT